MDISRFRNSRPKQKTPKDIWDWWLSDEKPPVSVQAEIRAERLRQANAYRPRSAVPPVAAAAQAITADFDDVKSIVINLHLPKPDLSRLASYLPRPAIKSRYAAAIVVLTVGIILVTGNTRHPEPKGVTSMQPPTKTAQTAINIQGGGSLSQNLTNTASENSQKPASSVLSANTGSTKPSFIPVVPRSKPQLADSPFATSAYNSDAGIYTFIDSFAGKPLTVNEQAVSSLNNSPSEALQQNAQGTGATEPISYSGGTAYMQPAGAGQQTVVLVLRGVAVYLNSPAAHSAAQWQSYIETLN